MENNDLIDNNLEEVTGGTSYPSTCHKSYLALVNKIYFGCNNLNVKPYCPSCANPLKVLTTIQMSEDELHAAHERGRVKCHECGYEGTAEDWTFSPNNHK